MSSSLALSLSLHPTAIQNNSHHTKNHQLLININHKNNNNNNNNHLPPILTNTTRSLENHAFSLLQSSSSFNHLTQIHAHIIRHSLHHSNFLITKLVSSCLSSHKPSYALQVFEQMPHPNIFLWNALIRGLVDLHAHHDAFLFYFRMLDSGFLPNNFTFPFVLKACSKLLALKLGKTVHSQILKLGFSLDVYTQTALLDFYGSCGEILAVRYLFDRMPERDVVCWNAVVASHIRCGLVDFAEEVFETMPVRNVSSWTTMIGGFVQSGKSVEALALFHQMQMDGVKPDKMAVVTILSAIADLGVLDLGRWVHNYVEKNGIRIDAFVGTALIDMYSKCGSVQAARAVFDAIGSKTIVCYNVMIMGFAVHGMGAEAIEVFKEAGRMGMGINDTTMIAILSACSNSGLVDEGCRYFNLMKDDYGVEAKMEHYRCMIDILGRAGRFDEAMEIVETKKVDPLVLGTLASACRIHGNVELGDKLARRMSELDPTAAVRRSMKDIGMGKRPWCSWIEVNNVVHEFVAGDHLHPCSKEIYSKLAELNEKMKSFVPKD